MRLAAFNPAVCMVQVNILTGVAVVSAQEYK